jgi:hypothetical protein
MAVDVAAHDLDALNRLSLLERQFRDGFQLVRARLKEIREVRQALRTRAPQRPQRRDRRSREGLETPARVPWRH